jgi:hypothetical protein
MKTFVLLVLTVTALFIWQKHDGSPRTASKPKAETSVAASTGSRPVSEHDWAKRSLDRTHEVMDQVAQTRQGADQP